MTFFNFLYNFSVQNKVGIRVRNCKNNRAFFYQDLVQEITTELSTTNGSDASFFQSTFLQTASGSLGDFVAIFVQRPIFSILEPADEFECMTVPVN